MNSDFNKIENFNRTDTTIATPPEPINPVQIAKITEINEIPNKSGVPYLALLTTFVILFASVVYSVIALVANTIDKLIINKKPDTNFSYIPDFSNYIIISAIAAFIVSLLILIVITVFLRKAELDEAWRKNQKWRRIIYTIGIIVLLLGLVGELTSTVYNLISINVGTDDITSSYSSMYSSENTKAEPSKDKKLTVNTLTGITSASLILLGLFVLGSEYASKRQKLFWISIIILALVGTGTSVFSINKIQEQIQNSKKQAASQATNYNNYGSTSSSLSNNYSYDETNANLDSVETSLSSYAANNIGKYPTEAIWNGDTFNSTYPQLSSTVFKKITYTPSGCDTSGCTSYTMSMINSNGKKVERNST